MNTALLTPFRSVFPYIARHLAAAHGEAGPARIAQVKLRHELPQVFGEGMS